MQVGHACPARNLSARPAMRVTAWWVCQHRAMPPCKAAITPMHTPAHRLRVGWAQSVDATMLLEAGPLPPRPLVSSPPSAASMAPATVVDSSPSEGRDSRESSLSHLRRHQGNRHGMIERQQREQQACHFLVGRTREGCPYDGHGRGG